MWAKKQKSHVGLSASKNSIFRVKFSLLIAEFSGDLCKQDCFLNGIAFIQIAPPFLMLSEFTLCPNPPMSTILVHFCFCVHSLLLLVSLGRAVAVKYNTDLISSLHIMSFNIR